MFEGNYHERRNRALNLGRIEGLLLESLAADGVDGSSEPEKENKEIRELTGVPFSFDPCFNLHKKKAQ